MQAGAVSPANRAGAANRAGRPPADTPEVPRAVTRSGPLSTEMDGGTPANPVCGGAGQPGLRGSRSIRLEGDWATGADGPSPRITSVQDEPEAQ